MKVEDKLAGRITRALQNVGIAASGVEIVRYDPELFGNHIAKVETNAGAIEVIFDRQYEVDLLESDILSNRKPEIERALMAEWRGQPRWFDPLIVVPIIGLWAIKSHWLRLLGR